jgi:hypothetical protein
MDIAPCVRVLTCVRYAFGRCSPLASSGANLQALMKCDAATSTERIRAKNIIKCKKTEPASADVTAAAPTKA